MGNQLHYKKYKQKLYHVEYCDGKCFNAVNMISKRDRNISKTCVFIFHSIQHDEASGYTFYGLSKTFNTLNHDLLIAKHHAYGSHIKTLKILHSYLKKVAKNKSEFKF